MKCHEKGVIVPAQCHANTTEAKEGFSRDSRKIGEGAALNPNFSTFQIHQVKLL
eukprot:UN23354